MHTQKSHTSEGVGRRIAKLQERGQNSHKENKNTSWVTRVDGERNTAVSDKVSLPLSLFKNSNMEKKWQGKKKRQGVTNIKDMHCLPPLKHLSCDTDKTTNSRCSCFFLYVCCIMMVRTLGVFHHPTLPTLHMGIFA